MKVVWFVLLLSNYSAGMHKKHYRIVLITINNSVFGYEKP